MIKIYTPWKAILFLVQHQANGGRIVGIPSLVPDPTFQSAPPSMTCKAEEANEEAAMALSIKLAIDDAVESGDISKRDVKRIIRAATMEHGNSEKTRLFNTGKAVSSPSFTKDENDFINRSFIASRVLIPAMKKRRVIWEDDE